MFSPTATIRKGAKPKYEVLVPGEGWVDLDEFERRATAERKSPGRPKQ